MNKYRDRLEEDVRNWYSNSNLNEATTDSGSRGSYVSPLQPGVKMFKKIDMQPYTIPVSKYNDAMLEYDSYDGSMDVPKKQINKIENRAKKISKFLTKHPELTNTDEDGGIINQTPGRNKKINEVSTSSRVGAYSGPIKLGLKKWKKSDVYPYNETSNHDLNKKSKDKKLKNNITQMVGVWEKNQDGTYDIDIHDAHTVNEWVEITEDTIVEDLGVWFGTKKKPKGSKQPKGPWVNICRKKEGGGHPPCGRPNATDKAYPKCRAAGVAAKMTDSQKKSACQQKRNAEKTHSKSGTGNSPKMTHYVPKKKKNESFNSLLKKVISEVLKK
jgi:hypothetical protein